MHHKHNREIGMWLSWAWLAGGRTPGRTVDFVVCRCDRAV